jgi:hypothetical protein
MRLTISITIGLLLFAGLAQAADVPTMKGDKAFVFMFDGFDDLDLDTYHGGFGMRYYFADYMAIRGGVIFDMYSETDEPCSNADPDVPDDEYSMTDIGVEVVFEKHLDGCGPSVSPYVGLGAGFGTMTIEEKEADSYYDMDDDEYVWGQTITTDDATYFEVFGVAGFEWAFTDCLTFGGEYILGFQSWSGSHEVDHVDPEEDTYTCDISGTWMGFGETSVFFSVYW